MSNKKKVMILDDNKDFLEILKNYVDTKEELEVVCYDYDGKNADKLIKEHKPDIILVITISLILSSFLSYLIISLNKNLNKKKSITTLQAIWCMLLHVYCIVMI